MKFYRAAPVSTIPAGQGSTGDTGRTDLAAGLPGAAPLIAIRAADLVPPCGRALAGGDRTALVVAGISRDPCRGSAGVREDRGGRAGGGPPRRADPGRRASRWPCPAGRARAAAR